LIHGWSWSIRTRSCGGWLSLDASHPGHGSLEEAEEIGVPAIVFWEIAVLSRKGRVELGEPVTTWTEGVLAVPRLRCLPATFRIASLADTLAMHQDPADRFIVATAIEVDAPLVTRDRELRKPRILKTIW